MNKFSHTFVPLALLLLCPPLSLVIWYDFAHLDGSLSGLFSLLNPSMFLSVVKPLFAGYTAWIMIGVFATLQLALMRYLPGPLFKGPATPKGHVPEYKSNGMLAFVITIAAFAIASSLNLFSATIIYDHFGELLVALNILSLVVCGALYAKGRFWPSSSDCGVSGNLIFDFYWGTELYPRIFGFDVKMFATCRFGMMSWGLIVLSFAAKQHELYGLSSGMIVAVLLQLVYVAKFFWWETGYLSSLDIMHDRAGFYICWGCMVWVPSVYTSATLFMVNHPLEMPGPAAMLLLVAGVVCIYTNYFADRQRQLVRETGGQCLVWGKSPEIILASFKSGAGQEMQSLLLISGFWGLSRHFHYVPEVLAALCWSLPAGFSFGLPYFYVSFLTVLLVHRAQRDDERCAKKYGKYWEAYCERVPSKIIPGIY